LTPHAGFPESLTCTLPQVCDDLGIEVIVEGVETLGEYAWFRRVGVRQFQG
jgi:EAL domain-containing protein (putative c-di-GMP-specific phosphodiesterase class I)